jgi:hypothetical protein
MASTRPLFDQPVEFTFEECEVLGVGSLKEHNYPADEIQRHKITQRGIDSDFKVIVTLVTCVHGILSEEDPTPASFMIFEYHLSCAKMNHVFDAVKTNFKFDFESVKDPKHAPRSEACPDVLAYAPFRMTERFDHSTSEIRKNIAREVKAGLDIPIAGVVVPKLEASQGTEREETYEQSYFAEGQADVSWDARSKRNYGVWWDIRHNEKKSHGVPSIFRTAILLKRQNERPFKAKFTCIVKGGLLFELKQKILGLVDPDDPINFDPNEPPKGGHGLNPRSLGLLADGQKLDSLAYVWGLTPFTDIQGA